MKDAALNRRRKRQPSTVQNSHTSPRKAKERARQLQALDLRAVGKSFPAIAREMKISVSTPHNYVVRAFQQLPYPEVGAEALRLELKRLDRMTELLSANFEKEPTVNHAEILLKLSHERARLLGLLPQNGQPSTILNLNIPGNNGAESKIITLEFVKSRHANEPLPPPSKSYRRENFDMTRLVDVTTRPNGNDK